MKWNPLKEGPKGLVWALNHLGALVTRAQPLEGRGVRVSPGPKGTLIELAPLEGSGYNPFEPMAITVDDPEADPKTYKVTVHEGWVMERITTRSGTPPDGVVEFMPRIEDAVLGWTLLNADPRPTLEMDVGDTAWLIYETDNKGEVKEDGSPDFNWPRIVANADANDSTHYQPADEVNTDGTLGDYRIPLFKLEADGDHYKVKLYQQSDVEHYHELPTFENLGTGKRVFKRREGDKYEFLSVKGTESSPLSGSSYEELKTHVEYDGADLAASADLKVRAWIETSSLDEHPWKVTANGDDTVAVAAGELLSFDHEVVGIPTAGNSNLSSYFNLKDFASWGGGNVTVEGTGVIYAKVSFANGGAYASDTFADSLGSDYQHWLDSIQPSGAITLHWAASLPSSGDVFTVKLAEVSLDAGDAVVDKQIVTHNPTLFVQQLGGFFDDI